MIPYYNYDTTLSNVKAQLDEFGLAVIPNILDQNEVAAMRKGMWAMLENVTQKFAKPIKQKDPASWREFFKLFPTHSMLIQSFCLAHSQYIWDIRQNEKVVEVFAKIWDCKKEDLITSFDAFSVHFPPETTGRGWYRGNKWLHVDQSYTRNGFECVQGFVTAWDINEGDATFTFFEKSHKKHKDFKECYDVKNKSDWYKLNEEESKFYTENGHPQRALKCSAGSIILWDSRLVHSGIEASKNRAKPNIRHVAYICQMPRKLASKAMMAKRIKAFEEMRTTSHWPTRVKLFPKTPRTYGNPIPPVVELPEPELSDLGKRLVGYL